MVVSSINKHVIYKETKTIEPEDIQHASHLYALNVFNNTTIAVVLGKLKYNFADKHVIYLPIYAVNGNRVRSKIGVFEFEPMKLSVMYKNGDIDIDKLSKPILFESFVNPAFIQKLDADPKQYIKHVGPIPDVNVANIEDAEDLAMFKVTVPETHISHAKQDAVALLDEGVFAVDTTRQQQLAPLPEETEADADVLHKEYKVSTGNTWMETFMKNNHYRIQENEGGGDCLFAVIRDAFQYVGKNTTVAKLRAVLANEITDEVFQTQRSYFMAFESQKKEMKFQMERIKKTILDYKKRAKQSTSPTEAKEIVDQVKGLTEEYNQLQIQYKSADALQNDDVGHMNEIDTLDKMRDHIRTSSYWADTWAISTLERVLKCKLVFFSEDAFREKSMDSVLRCGEANKTLEDAGVFTPEYYIFTGIHARHYRLITYKDRPIFKYAELPYDIKMLVLNKCLEKNAGIYYLIQDFRNLKTRLGLNPDEGRPEADAELDGEGVLFQSDVVFVFYGNAEKAAKPGKADGEKIPETKRSEYTTLSKIDEWRKKLDDSWIGNAIAIDAHNWASVSHYLEGAKYKKGYPDMYLQFSLDSGSDIAKEPKPELAHKKLKIQGEGDKKPKALKIDVDYALGRDAEERKKALRAKFRDNALMATLLKETKTALLKKKEKRGTPAVPDVMLMQLRAEL